MAFRCGHQALALIVQTELKLDPHSGVTVVFRSKRGDRLKILVWDGTGPVLIYKVLESGSFSWPKAQAGSYGCCARNSRPCSRDWTGGEWLAKVCWHRLRQDDSSGRFWRCFNGLSVPNRVESCTSPPLDLSQFPDLPPEVVKAFAVVQFELSVERAARQHEQAVVAKKEAFITELKALIEKLEGQVQDCLRIKFEPKSENLDPAQLKLALEGEPSRRHRFKPDDERKPPSPRRRRRSLRSRTGSRPANRTPRSASRAHPARHGHSPKACRAPYGWSSPTTLPAPAAAAT